MMLKKKILIGYGAAFALMGIVVVWAITNLVSLGKATNAILNENYRSILAAGNMLNVLERQDSGMLLMFLGDTKKGITLFRENEANFLEWFARAKDNITIQGESEIIQSIEVDYMEYRKQFSMLTDLPGSNESSLKIACYNDKVYPLFVKVRIACIGLRTLNEKTMYAASAKAGGVARRAIWSTAFVATLALIVVFVFSIFLTERIVRPIHRFMEASRKISTGNYVVRVPVETSDELGCLADEFNQMAQQLSCYHEMNIDQIISEKNKGDAILSSIEDGLVVFDTRLNVTGINPAARRLLDLEFTDCTTLQCATILPVPKVCDLIRKVIETGVQHHVPDEQRIIVLSKGDQPRHYLFSVTPILHRRDNNISGTVLLLRDVTRLKEVEQLKSEFVMAASHELRTPLTGLGMSVDLLLEHAANKLDDKDKELLQAAHEEVHRMKALVNDLLDLSKIEAGRIEMDFESVPITTLFEHVEAVFKSQMDMKGLVLTSEVADDLPNVRADANKVTWVLTNLISNALRYVNKGGHIHLMAHRIGPHVHISVQDDGPGIPLEYQSRIFQKFVQVKDQNAGGTGLGLAICKEIVRAHGGTIWVESGRGSIFTFTLPVVQ